MTAPRPDGASWTDSIVGVFLRSNLSLVLLLLAIAAGAAALRLTPREEDPQIVVPVADVHVRFPGRSAREVEQLVSAPLERLLYQIDGVEHVHSMSREGSAIVTVRFFVGEDRERSLVKLRKRIDENVDVVPPGVTDWVVRPVEIDDVPVVTLTLRSATADGHVLRRVAEEMAARLARVEDVSRLTVVGGEPRVMHVRLDPSRLQAYGVAPLEVLDAVRASNVSLDAGSYERDDASFAVEAGPAIGDARALADLVIAVRHGAPVVLDQVADVVDGPAEVATYVRHGFGPARGFERREDVPGARLGDVAPDPGPAPTPAVTIGVAKKKGTNAVSVADRVLDEARFLERELVPDDVELVVTRNSGRTADDKVNELIEALAVAVFIVIGLLTLSLGWREALVVALAVPIVFGLTLASNLLFGLTINRVTLFALILSIGLLVDDPIVDVENITRHFVMRGRATREIVLEAIREIRPPLVSATLAVIVSFLPMFFITGMMGPYMQPMAVGVPVAMAMSLLVAFTITPWLSFHLLRGRFDGRPPAPGSGEAEDDPDAVKRTRLYRLFRPLMAPILASRPRAWAFLAVFGVATAAAASLALTRHVPLKMLPFDDKNELRLVVDAPEGTTLERTDAAVRDLEALLAGVREVTGFTSYVGTASPMDFNGLVRHDYLRSGPDVAEVRIDLVGKRSRRAQSHAIGLGLRDGLDDVARRHGVVVKLVELPPGPPVLATLVAEVRGPVDARYDDLVRAADVVRERLAREPGVVDVDWTVEAAREELVFVADQEKAALNGVSVEAIARTLELALDGASAGTVRAPDERQPLDILVRLPRAARSGAHDLQRLRVAGRDGALVPLPELGRWERSTVDRTIHHKDLEPIVYVLAEVAGRPPADVVMDVAADRAGLAARGEPGVDDAAPRPLEERSFLDNGGGITWSVPDEIDVAFDGEGEWDITLDVFRDLGIAFAAALLAIYVILVAQTGSFLVPVVVMLAIPLTILGIMPGFRLLNAAAAGEVGGYADPIFFTATGMIGMIALAGIVTRDSIILVDFVHQAQARGRTLFDAIMESRVVRLRPILLTSATAMLSAAPITIDPIFSGLAWSLIFGLLASTVFTLFVIPVTYWLAYAGRATR